MYVSCVASSTMYYRTVMRNAQTAVCVYVCVRSGRLSRALERDHIIFSVRLTCLSLVPISRGLRQQWRSVISGTAYGTVWKSTVLFRPTALLY